MGAAPGTIGGDRFQSTANGLLRKVAIDLTPMLPGGANGGAKVFILHLIRDLARLAPSCEFLLLTHEGTYAELADLEGANVRRVLIPGPQPVKPRRRGARSRAQCCVTCPSAARRSSPEVVLTL